jgi:hypothetical protein
LRRKLSSAVPQSLEGKTILTGKLVPSLLPCGSMRIPNESMLVEHHNALIRHGRFFALDLELVLVSFTLDPTSQGKIF